MTGKKTLSQEIKYIFWNLANIDTIGISYNTLNSHIKGRREPSEAIIEIYCKGLKIERDTFIELLNNELEEYKNKKVLKKNKKL